MENISKITYNNRGILQYFAELCHINVLAGVFQIVTSKKGKFSNFYTKR